MSVRTRYGMLALAALATISVAVAGPKRGAKAPAKKAGAVKVVGVDELAGNPDKHLGPVVVTGVVATAQAGKGFVLIDTNEYKACGVSCLTEAGTKKVPVRWTGAAPKVEQAVRVDGTLTQTKQGLAFTARKVAKA